MNACGHRPCVKPAVFQVSVPSYQQDACAEHLADIITLVASERYGPHYRVEVTILDEPAAEQTDRRVHAELGDKQVVRYDRAGKWCIEYEPANLRASVSVSLRLAVAEALAMREAGGSIHVGLPGGLVFDRQIRQSHRSR